MRFISLVFPACRVLSWRADWFFIEPHTENKTVTGFAKAVYSPPFERSDGDAVWPRARRQVRSEGARSAQCPTGRWVKVIQQFFFPVYPFFFAFFPPSIATATAAAATAAATAAAQKR